MSLDECIVKALKDNLGVAIQVLGPQISAEAVNQAQEKFIPTLSLSAQLEKDRERGLSPTWTPRRQLDQQDAELQLPQRQPAAADRRDVEPGPHRLQDDDQHARHTINPRFGTTLSFQLNQPLLKNFGFKVNRREILVASNNLGVSEESLKNTLMTTIYNVESAYWSARLQHREPRRPPPVPPAGQGPPREEPALGRGRHPGPHGGPQRPGRGGHPRGRPHPGRDPDQEQRGPAEAPAPHHRGRGQRA